MIKIKDNIFISEDLLIFKYSRSGGPGGQNVNKVNTRVTVFFDVPGCQSLSDFQKRRILNRLTSRANKADQIRVASEKHRTRKANRSAAIKRLVELLAEALKQKPPRRKTKTPRRAIQRRLEEKKRRSILKQQRTKVELQ